MMNFEALYHLYDYYCRLEEEAITPIHYDFEWWTDFSPLCGSTILKKHYLTEICKLFEIPLDKSGRAVIE